MAESSLTADLLAWCMILFLPAFAAGGPLRRDRDAAMGYLIAVFLHIVAAVVYIYVPGVLPPRGDAIVFHKVAIAMLTASEWPFGFGSLIYKWCLAHVYNWVGPSWLFASVLSVYAFALSVVLLAKLMEMLDVRQGKGLVIVLFGALPTAVLYGSVPMRETYQVLFFMCACYFMLRFRLSGNPLYLPIAILSALLMGLLHKGLLVYAPFLIVVILLVRIDVGAKRRSAANGRAWLHRIMAVSLAVGFIAALPMAAQNLQGVQGTSVLGAVSSDGLADFAAQQRTGDSLARARTTYGVTLDTSSATGFVSSMLMIVFCYLFTPFPWQISTFEDIYAFGEVVMRAAALYAIFRMWRAKDRVHPHLIKVLMIVYLTMAALWASGTTNYGTATRHHMVHQWIILVLGVPALLEMIPGFASPASRPSLAPAGQRQPARSPATDRPRRLGGGSSLKPRPLAVASIQPRGLKS